MVGQVPTGIARPAADSVVRTSLRRAPAPIRTVPSPPGRTDDNLETSSTSPLLVDQAA
jgi:hypothetical protein